MFFKNLQLFRVPAPWEMTAEQLEACLAPQTFAPCTSLDMQSQGWISPRDNGMLVHTVNRQMLIVLGTEKKLLPASVINQVSKARAAEIEEQQGFQPGRKQMREIKEQVTDELLPRAFSIQSKTWTWIDPVNGWLAIDASSSAKADEVIKLLLKSVDGLPLEMLRVKRSPIPCMTEWLATDEAPAGFTVDQDTELRAAGEGKATVRYLRHTLEAGDMGRHIAGGKQCTRLAMTWSNKVSFVLTEALAVKRIAPLNILKETADAKNEDERFDSDVMLMTGELAKMLADLCDALGGLDSDQTDWVQDGAKDARPMDQLQQGVADALVAAGVEVVGYCPQSSDEAGDELYLYDAAVAIVRNQRRASIPLVQRCLQISYSLASRLLDAMEKNGVVSAQTNNGNRTVLEVAA